MTDVRKTVNKIKGLWETYSIIRKLSSIDGPDADNELLDCVMYNSRTLPPLGKEYWWFLFFDQNGEKPMQLMFLIFRKHGKKLLFNDKEMVLSELGENKFQAVTAGWVYDGKQFHDLGDTNTITEIQDKKIVTDISGQEMVLSGSFPDYRLKVGNTIDLNTKKANYVEDRDACGVFLPPFGMGWVDIFLKTDGVVMEKEFKGAAHLQKVTGVTIFGPFHWGRIVFQNGSSTSFFCLKTGKNSKKFFRKFIVFHDTEDNNVIQFNKPKLKISKREGDALWVIEGKDNDKDFRMVLETHAKKQFTIKGRGSQVYNEYVVTPKEFNLKTKGRVITLDDLGEGVGTFEDAYW